MDLVWHWVTYAFFVVLLVAAAMIIPRCQRVQPALDDDDVYGLDPTESRAIDAGVRVADLRHGDAVCCRLGDDDLSAVFGWVAALPGDEVAVADGQLVVGGKPAQKGGKVQLPALTATTVPRDSFFLISDQHRHDSFAVGPIPAASLRGRLGSLP